MRKKHPILQSSTFGAKPLSENSFWIDSTRCTVCVKRSVNFCFNKWFKSKFIYRIHLPNTTYNVQSTLSSTLYTYTRWFSELIRSCCAFGMFLFLFFFLSHLVFRMRHIKLHFLVWNQMKCWSMNSKQASRLNASEKIHGNWKCHFRGLNGIFFFRLLVIFLDTKLNLNFKWIYWIYTIFEACSVQSINR